MNLLRQLKLIKVGEAYDECREARKIYVHSIVPTFSLIRNHFHTAVPERHEVIF